jgi:multiple sugar transport system substrate-binding protein
VTAHGGRPSRRDVLRWSLASALAAPFASGCAGFNTSGGGGGAEAVSFLSTQFAPIEERARYTQVLEKYAAGHDVSYNPVEANVFSTTVTSQVRSGSVQISIVGGLHGDLAPLADHFIDLEDVTVALTDVGMSPELVELSRFGGAASKYIPWMQASYILAVNKKALEWLPSGADVNALTYDQFLDWGRAAKDANGGKPQFGFPAGPKGLYHRFFQGFLIPSFTGGQITTFRNADAVTAWEYMKELWSVMAPASTNFDFMQEPLQRGEVLVAWDHVARLIDAPKDSPGDWLMVPAPSGPKGLGYLRIIAGMAVPVGAKNEDKAVEVIKTLANPEAQLETAEKMAFFPVVDAELPPDLPAVIQLEATALERQEAAPNAISALPPVGLGAKDGEVSGVFKDCFTSICLDNRPIQPTLDQQARVLQRILDELKVPCWKPDPAGDPCRVA